VGANAVNGVINVITKNAADTQGGLLTVGGGSTQHFFHPLRYGTQYGEKRNCLVLHKILYPAKYLVTQ